MDKALKEYIESFGWRIEECTAKEIRQAKRELKDIRKGMIILDGVLAMKPYSPKIEKMRSSLGLD